MQLPWSTSLSPRAAHDNRNDDVVNKLIFDIAEIHELCGESRWVNIHGWVHRVTDSIVSLFRLPPVRVTSAQEFNPVVHQDMRRRRTLSIVRIDQDWISRMGTYIRPHCLHGLGREMSTLDPHAC